MSSQTVKLIAIDSRGTATSAPVYSINFGAVSHPEQMRSSLARQAPGTRQHQPITAVTGNNPSSPLRFASLRGTPFPQVRLEFYRPDLAGSGETELFYIIVLGNATIASCGRRIVPVLSSKDTHEAEQIEICFQTITWMLYSGASSGSDPWSQDS